MQEPPPTSLVWKVAHSLLHARGDMSQEPFLSSFLIDDSALLCGSITFLGLIWGDRVLSRYEEGEIKTRLCTKNWGTLS